MKLKAVALTGVMSLAGWAWSGLALMPCSPLPPPAPRRSRLARSASCCRRRIPSRRRRRIRHEQHHIRSGSASEFVVVTAPQLITILNNGNVTATEISMKLTDLTTPPTWRAPRSTARRGCACTATGTRLQRTHDHGGRLRLGRHRCSNHRTQGHRHVHRRVLRRLDDGGCGTRSQASAGTRTPPLRVLRGARLRPQHGPLAASLNSAAEGGTITPTFTVSYSG